MPVLRFVPATFNACVIKSTDEAIVEDRGAVIQQPQPCHAAPSGVVRAGA